MESCMVIVLHNNWAILHMLSVVSSIDAEEVVVQKIRKEVEVSQEALMKEMCVLVEEEKKMSRVKILAEREDKVEVECHFKEVEKHSNEVELKARVDQEMNEVKRARTKKALEEWNISMAYTALE
ncbi:hypothetical protein Adt_05653 [Abeliophyllum distichum]|uniref:Uncharacterized protein n=1 Tax=Abeliophyllum distichum TaxID=126358 RepID=A0ABD1V4N9_9LAMI